MIQGVRAETIAMIDFERAARLFELTGWSWLGLPGPFATRCLQLRGTPPRDCRLRVTQVQTQRHGLVCTVQLESPEAAPGNPLIRGEVTLTRAPSGTPAGRSILTFHGLTARNLASTAGPASADSSRHLANAYARSFLEQVAGGLERDGAAPSGSAAAPASRHQPAAGPLTGR